MLFDFLPLEKIIRCDTLCNNDVTCIGLEQCSCPKDYFGQYCTSKLLLCAYSSYDNWLNYRMYNIEMHTSITTSKYALTKIIIKGFFIYLTVFVCLPTFQINYCTS